MKNKIIKHTAVCLLGAATVITLIAAAPNGFRFSRNMELLINMFRELSLFYVDEVDSDKLMSDAAAGMTRNLDPYTEYISEKDMKSFEVLTTGKYGGIGSTISEKDGYVIFAEPYKGSPADKHGIQPGDKIVEIEGKDASKMTTAEVSSLLKGEAGTNVKLKVEKFYTGEVVPIKIKREIIARSGIAYYGMATEEIGYIAHSEFTEDCSSDMRNALMELKSQGAQSLIIDYRNNGGGIMQEAIKILSFFVPRNTEVVCIKGRGENVNAEYFTQNEPIDLEIPIVVLTNGGSASASEIVAGALQDVDRAVLMGQKTFGKGLVQSTRYIGYNSFLKLTTAKYYLPSGRCIQAIDYSKGNDANRENNNDSAVREFTTRNGRKVSDGGGITPDITIANEYASRFAYILYGKGYISDFADLYCRNSYGKKAITPGEFTLSDDDYNDFISFMSDKDVEWESETKLTLKLLKERAEQELYIDDIADNIRAIEERLKDDKATNLSLHRKELTNLIETEIMLRTNYMQGATKHNIQHDTDIQAAIELLSNPEEYRKIILPAADIPQQEAA